jgi:hypothetical protein
MDKTPPKVFISYSWDSPEHKNRVLQLSTRLRSEGVDCQIDQYVEFPPEGWLRWMENQLEWADFVLVICTEQYRQRFRGQKEGGKGRGATWEGAIIAQELYDEYVNNTKFVPVLFFSQDSDYIPSILRRFSRYLLDTEEGYEKLYRYLTNQQLTPIPELGKLRTLPPRERNQDFDKLSEEKEDYAQLSPKAVDELPSQRKRLFDALINAFPTRTSLEQMLLFELNKNLDAIAGGSNLREITFNLIKTAEAEGWVEDLINAARKSNPKNPLLLALDLPHRELNQDFDKLLEEKEDYSQLSPEALDELLTKKAKLRWHQTSGNLNYKDYYIVDATNSANVKLRDFIVEAKFYNPYNGADHRWQYGFSFRETSSDVNDHQRQVYTLWISSDNQILSLNGPGFRVEEKISNLDVLENGSNQLRLIAAREIAIVFVNDVYIQKFDISDLMRSGKVYLVSTGIGGKSAKYENFKLWSISN